MVEIKGKRGRKVPLLLTEEVKGAMDVLVETRSEVGINPENPYLFATTGNGSLGHLRPWECMRKVVTSDELKLEKPEAVTSTKLGKYVATVSQILDLQENELDWLARHLGHDITVHREYYRLHESTIELAKVGKILTTVDEGKTQRWAGKSLDDIDLDKDFDPVAGRYKPFPWQVLGGNASSLIILEGLVLLLVLNGKSENVNSLATKWTKVLNCKSFKKQY